MNDDQRIVEEFLHPLHATPEVRRDAASAVRRTRSPRRWPALAGAVAALAALAGVVVLIAVRDPRTPAPGPTTNGSVDGWTPYPLVDDLAPGSCAAAGAGGGRQYALCRAGSDDPGSLVVRESEDAARTIAVAPAAVPDAGPWHWQWAAVAPDGVHVLLQYEGDGCKRLPMMVTVGQPKAVGIGVGTPGYAYGWALGWSTDGRAMLALADAPACHVEPGPDGEGVVDGVYAWTPDEDAAIRIAPAAQVTGVPSFDDATAAAARTIVPQPEDYFTGATDPTATVRCVPAGTVADTSFELCQQGTGKAWIVRKTASAATERWPLERPDPGGRWEWAAVSPDRRELLLQWIARCGGPFAYTVAVGESLPVTVRGEGDSLPPTAALGWTPAGDAVFATVPTTGCGAEDAAAIWARDSAGNVRKVQAGGVADVIVRRTHDPQPLAAFLAGVQESGAPAVARPEPGPPNSYLVFSDGGHIYRSDLGARRESIADGTGRTFVSPDGSYVGLETGIVTSAGEVVVATEVESWTWSARAHVAVGLRVGGQRSVVVDADLSSAFELPGAVVPSPDGRRFAVIEAAPGCASDRFVIYRLDGNGRPVQHVIGTGPFGEPASIVWDEAGLLVQGAACPEVPTGTPEAPDEVFSIWDPKDGVLRGTVGGLPYGIAEEGDGKSRIIVGLSGKGPTSMGRVSGVVRDLTWVDDGGGIQALVVPVTCAGGSGIPGEASLGDVARGTTRPLPGGCSVSWSHP